MQNAESEHKQRIFTTNGGLLNLRFIGLLRYTKLSPQNAPPISFGIGAISDPITFVSLSFPLNPPGDF